MCVICVRHAQNQAGAVSWATRLKTKFRGHLFHPQPPTFCGFHLGIAQRDPYTPVPVVASCSRRAAQPAHGWGQRWVPKKNFSKVVPRPLGMLKQVFLARFEPVVARFGPWKIPYCLENGLFWDKNGSKMGQKRIFPKVILDHLGCSDKFF